MPPRLPLLLLAVALAACSGAREQAGLGASLTNMQASLAAVAPPAAPRPTPAVQPVRAIEPRVILPGPAPAPPLRTGPGPRSATDLLGQTPEQIRLHLGEPVLRRAEGGGAEIWLYAADACALDLVLYRERGGGLRVAHAAARAAGEAAESATEAECLGRIAGGPAARPAT